MEMIEKRINLVNTTEDQKSLNVW